MSRVPYLVAITRLAASTTTEEGRAAEAAALAPILSVGAYELRVLLGGGAPLVLGGGLDVDRARALLGAVRARGHGAIACDEASVTSSDALFQPRDFTLGEGAIEGSAEGTTAHLSWGDICAVITAMLVERETTTVEGSKRSFSAGRALMSGGLLVSKKTKTSRSETEEVRVRAAYLMHRSGAGHWLVTETGLRYAGLGARIGHSTNENFTTLLAIVRQHTPHALHDDRLLTQKRAAGLTGASLRAAKSSNAAQTDEAAHLLTVAHLQGQL